MTGYGRHSIQTDRYRLTVEIRSLNSKFLEINLKLPGLFRSKEAEVRTAVAKLCTRGKVELSVQYQWLGSSSIQNINKELIQAYIGEFKTAAEGLEVNDGILFNSALRMPNTTFSPEEELPEDLWSSYLEAYQNASAAFVDFRKREGDVVQSDFSKSIAAIQSGLSEIKAVDADRIEEKKTRLRDQLSQLSDSIKVDENRFEQELIYYLEKIDISEEKSRLAEHCTYFSQVLKNSMPEKGKKLNFISQEIVREINTIGSKANNATIQRMVVEMKDELEKIKEQTANIV